MEWSVKIHRKVLKFLENLQDDEKNKVSERTSELIYSLEKVHSLYIILILRSLEENGVVSLD